MHHKKWLAVLALAAGAVAAQEQLPPEVTNGFRFAANTVLFKPSEHPRPLAIATPEGPEKAAAEDAAKAFAGGVTRAALLSRKGRIFHEAYARGVTADSTPFAFSMTKTLVAVTVGKALCDGLIRSLDEQAEVYAPQLQGTSYGAASIRQLLTMSSGASKSDFATGHPSGQESFLLRNMYQPRGLDIDLLDRMKVNTGHAPPGSEFNYNNYDTQALVLVTEGATRSGFDAYFEKAIWSAVRAEKSGAWLRNHKGTVVGFAGFSAAPRDYLRIGYYLLEEMRNENTCFSRYLAEATASHATPMPGRGYGYQVHKLSLRNAPESFWFLGFGGQVLGVDPRSDTVIYLYQGSFATTAEWVRLTSTLMAQSR